VDPLPEYGKERPPTLSLPHASAVPLNFRTCPLLPPVAESFELVTAPALILSVVTELDARSAVAIVPSEIFADVILLFPRSELDMAPSTIFAEVILLLMTDSLVFASRA